MRVAFAGTPEFAAVALKALLDAGHQVVLVLTQPDRPGGRGMKPRASAVKQYAEAHALPLLQPRSLRLDGAHPEDAAAAHEALRQAAPDVLVVAAYGLLLPPWVLALPRLGGFNIHASLLPRWRGAAPIQRAVQAGDARTGVTIMQMDAGLDTGDILLAEPIALNAAMSAGQLHDALAVLGARLIVQALADAERGTLKRVAQPTEGASYAHKIGKDEAEIDWSEPARVIARKVLAFDPFPGARTSLRGQPVKVWRARAEDRTAAASTGRILAVDAGGIVVACGDGAVRLTELQRAGGRRLAARDFLAGFEVRVGERFGTAPGP